MTFISSPFRLGVKNGNYRIGATLLICLSLATANCETGTVPNVSGERRSPETRVPEFSYEIVNTFLHDPDAYTQGLIFHQGKLLESTGRPGKSSLRRVEIETGKVVQQVSVAAPYFAEGITLLKGRVYQLTWQHQKGFVYDAETFAKISEFSYQGEGWGLTNDGNSLILSDGTNRLRFLDPNSFEVRKTLSVVDNRAPVGRLNELEFIKGEIYANIWTEDRIARIDSQTGRVVGWIQLAGLIARNELTDEEAVLNGIAYDEVNDRLFVTGKLWPKLFEIRLKQR